MLLNIVDYKEDNTIELSSEEVMNEYSLLIPKKYARCESNEYLGSQDEVKKVPHYELYIEPQIGSYKTRKNTYIYFKLPESGRIVNIILYPDGGVSFDKSFHKYILKETDELDRRIVLGFCDKYHDSLIYACHSKLKKRDSYLDLEASTYRVSKYKKRIKSGPSGHDSTDFYLSIYDKFEPYEESVIFKNVDFI